MKYCLLMIKAAHLFLFGYLTDSCTHFLDWLLEKKIHEKKPLSTSVCTTLSKVCEALFRKWLFYEKQFLLFQSRIVLHHDDL